MKAWKCRASFYSTNGDLLDKQTIEVKGDGIPCFKIPEGAACVFIKVDEEPEVSVDLGDKLPLKCPSCGSELEPLVKPRLNVRKEEGEVGNE